MIKDGRKFFIVAVLLFAVCVGIFWRFYRITDNTFVYYDEGLWLNENRDFVDALIKNPAGSFSELLEILKTALFLSLSNTKPLWQFLINLRGFLYDYEAWFFPRIISALCGCLTLGMVYVFSRRYYQDKGKALLITALLAIYPSHVYYSRLAIQESLSTLFFLLGIYFYIFSEKLDKKAVISAVCFACVYLSNYRMIILPVVTGFIEVFSVLCEKRAFILRKYIGHSLLFFVFIFGIGGLFEGSNLYVTFVWIFRQAQSAEGHLSLLNMFSYPYYMFRLEGVVFGALFFANAYYFVVGKRRQLLPFALVIFLMVLFSFPQEKAVRYLCSVMPFMVMSVGSMLVDFWRQAIDSRKKVLIASVLLCVIALFLESGAKARNIVQFHTAYEKSAEDIIAKIGNSSGFLSSQPELTSLFAAKQETVKQVPGNFEKLTTYYQEGYRYLILDPQVFIPLGAKRIRFNTQLRGYLDFIFNYTKATVVYDHFSPQLLERFVFEHNENLGQSLKFLKQNENNRFGKLYVYDLDKVFSIIYYLMEIANG